MKNLLFSTLLLSLLVTIMGCSQQQIQPAQHTTSKAQVVEQPHRYLRHQSTAPHKVYQPQLQKKRIQRPFPPVQRHAYQKAPYQPTNSAHELRLIGDKIFRNEAGSVKSKLVHWNHGENFAAMGIGHFTWYPAGSSRHRFGNTFPGLLGYLEQHGEQLPQWLKVARQRGAPWKNRAHLMRAKANGSLQTTQLESLLYRTRYLQAAYIIQRAKRAMPKLVKKSPRHLRSHVANNLNAVANTPGGWYALVDYTNFKGEGLNRRGGYKGQNWGLLQVLENMRPARPGPQALNHFSSSAMQVLRRRVRNSPRQRNEARWLAGWSRRVNTYRYPLVTRL